MATRHRWMRGAAAAALAVLASAACAHGPRSLFPTGALRLMATPIGGPGVARSGPVLVSAGQTVTFTIQPDLAASMAAVY